MGAAEKIKMKDAEKYSYKDYLSWEDGENWEIIEGKAYAMAPSPYREHQETAGKIHSDIHNFLRGKTCKVYYEWDVILSDYTVVKPDIAVVCDKNKITKRGIKGAPDMVVEILSQSTKKRDKVIKYELYKNAGVKEYWIVDPLYKEITVYNFVDNQKDEYSLDDEGEPFVNVGIFGGELKIDMRYIFEEDEE